MDAGRCSGANKSRLVTKDRGEMSIGSSYRRFLGSTSVAKKLDEIAQVDPRTFKLKINYETRLPNDVNNKIKRNRNLAGDRSEKDGKSENMLNFEIAVRR